MPMAASSATDAQLPLLPYENDTLEIFLDRSFLTLYDHLMAQTGSHAQAARVLGVGRTSLYQRLDRARSRLRGRGLE